MVIRKSYTHGTILKSKSTKDDLGYVYAQYQIFLSNISTFEILGFEGVSNLVDCFNTYRTNVLNILESRINSGQENLRSSMLEEFFCHLFSDLSVDILGTIPENFFLGKSNAYVDLTFSPASFKGFFINPHPYFHSKDQDFILGANLKISIESSAQKINSSIKIPFVAIECKTYIERNMLDSCSGTARRLKSAMPYCLYIVASEYMKLKDEQPELSDINEIYILCKASNSDRDNLRNKKLPPHKIDTDLVFDLFEKVKGHLNSIWWAPEKALITGKVINRP
jgi:hypothetical protein